MLRTLFDCLAQSVQLQTNEKVNGSHVDVADSHVFICVFDTSEGKHDQQAAANDGRQRKETKDLRTNIKII
uniref:Uncharacterized protein n=1 Tax=Caenorhabditis japonica TaxID=281687 RepID=A0A8R1I9F1_CAEJA